jgi:hypothetical protein
MAWESDEHFAVHLVGRAEAAPAPAPRRGLQRMNQRRQLLAVGRRARRRQPARGRRGGGVAAAVEQQKDSIVGGAPGRPFRSGDPAESGQVGCVYAAHGLKYDWSGVIPGPQPDLAGEC